MKLLVAFLFACFLLGGTRFGEPLLRRPVLMIGISTVVAASYWSLRMLN